MDYECDQLLSRSPRPDMSTTNDQAETRSAWDIAKYHLSYLLIETAGTVLASTNTILCAQGRRVSEGLISAGLTAYAAHAASKEIGRFRRFLISVPPGPIG